MLEHNITHEGVVISSDLERAQEPSGLLSLLKQFGLLDEDIAQVTGSHTRTVRRWKIAGPSIQAASRLGQLRNLILLLRASEGLTDLGIASWLRHANRLLDDYTPMQVLNVGAFRSVRKAAICFVDTNQAFDEPLAPETLEELHRHYASGVSQAPRKLTGSGAAHRLSAVK